MIYGVVGTLDRDTMMKFGLFNIKTGRFTRPASKKGNGKTMVLVYYGYREHKEQGRKVYSNFHTCYSIYRPAQEIFDDLGRILDLAGKFGGYGTIVEIIKGFDKIFAEYRLTQVEQTELYELRALYYEYFGSMILLTEFQKYFNSLGTSTKTIKWIEGILTQLRKLEIDLMWDSQRPISAGNRSREYTETYLVPQKFHLDDGTPCDQDICDSGPDREHYIKVFSDVPFRESPLCELRCSDVGKYYETNEIIGDNLCSPVEKDDEAKEKSRRKSRDRKAQEKDPAKKKEVIKAPSIADQEEMIRISTQVNDEEPIVTVIENPERTRKEIEIIKNSKRIPLFLIGLLPEYIARGKVHDLYSNYYNEDGTLKDQDPIIDPEDEQGRPEGIQGWPEEPRPEIPEVPAPGPGTWEIPEPEPEPTLFEIPDLSPFTPVHLPNDPEPKPDLEKELSPEEAEAAIDDLEMKMLKEAPHVPAYIKDLLLIFRREGKIHSIFVIYFTEDGIPKLPAQLEALHKDVKKAIG